MKFQMKSPFRVVTLRVITLGSLFLFCLHWLVKFEQVSENGDFENLDIPVEVGFEPLGIKDEEVFSIKEPIIIPKIIHQTWKNEMIPRRLTDWIKSWVRNHPGWDYWLWTDDSARQMIADNYPWFLHTYDSYSENIRRADALRYFVLYKYGGVYADMDMENLKSLEPLLYKYSCFLGQEPYEHSILDSNFEHLAINAIMGCNEKHPFMKSVIENLTDYFHMWHVLDSTGPHFLTLQYRRYTREHPLPNNDAVYLSPAEYFFPTIDPSKFITMGAKCAQFYKLNDIQKTACKTLKVKGIKRKPTVLSFATHHWMHIYFNLGISLKGPVNIHTFVPNVNIYRKTAMDKTIFKK